jgi:hypothetical protein
MRPEVLNPELPGYWATENQSALKMTSARADYEIAVWKEIGKPHTRREDVPQDFLNAYDWLNSPTVIRPNEAIVNIHSTLNEIKNADLSRMVSRDNPLFNYLQGLISSLEASIHIPDPGFKTEPPIDAGENRAKIRELLADTKAEEVAWNAGKSGEDFMRQYPNWPSRLNGYAAGYEWVLGLRGGDLVAEIQEKIDKLPKPSWVTPKA